MKSNNEIGQYCVRNDLNNAGSFESHAWIECVVLNHIRLGFVNFDTFIKHKHIRKDEKKFINKLSSECSVSVRNIIF